MRDGRHLAAYGPFGAYLSTSKPRAICPRRNLVAWDAEWPGTLHTHGPHAHHRPASRLAPLGWSRVLIFVVSTFARLRWEHQRWQAQPDCVAAVDVDGAARDVIRGRAAQEAARVSNVVWCAYAPPRQQSSQSLDLLLRAELALARRVDPAGANHVDIDAIFREFGGEAGAEVRDGGLAHAVDGGIGKRHLIAH